MVTAEPVGPVAHRGVSPCDRVAARVSLGATSPPLSRLTLLWRGLGRDQDGEAGSSGGVNGDLRSAVFQLGRRLSPPPLPPAGHGAEGAGSASPFLPGARPDESGPDPGDSDGRGCLDARVSRDVARMAT